MQASSLGLVSLSTSATSAGAGSKESYFVTTHWTVVLAAGKQHTEQSDHALAALCRVYWRPLYTYVRRRGYSAHDAEDLTQEFFARLLARNDVATVSPERGKFRSYLLAAINHFLSDEWDKARAQKRGGGQVIHLDSAVAESLYAAEHADGLAPERLFDQRWAITVLEEVYRQLRQEYEREGKAALFESLRFALMGERSAVPYADLADKLNLSEAAVKVSVHRLRKRYRQVLRELVAGTVSSPDEVEAEMRYLLRALADAHSA
jgi:RNA polymerase sigma factor (sigma-70 family)